VGQGREPDDHGSQRGGGAVVAAVGGEAADQAGGAGRRGPHADHEQSRSSARAAAGGEAARTNKRVAVVAAAAEEEQQTVELVDEVEAPSSLWPEEKRRIKELARNVVHDPDGHLTEKVLLRLLRISRNRRRWGFLSPDHPVHAYYLQQKDIERCRMLRSEHPAAGMRLLE
jgi:hypothetical protein